MSHAISDEALDTIFRAARSHNRWSDEPVSAALLMAVYDLMRWGPTSGNITPARFLFLTSTEAKLRLKPYLDEGNKEKSMTAPVVTIIGYDLDFPETLAKLKPRSPNAKHHYDGKPERVREDAFRNGSLQGAYFMIAARALGLDCGPMGGFDRSGVDKEFFAGSGIKSNFLCALGHGNPAALNPRAPRLSFDEACRII
ncbi:MAG TPA: malonic semialdehyde reductase [Rhizomicrobium sp.]|jgi:3-hydroxypropanoate dehydrogenase|nr:malonic semialdehyde reductase [Rhizomicrobium sp.]